ncbi:MAG: phasin family protein [Robiginitomaculum sp.]|nr:phasin family protein [Robiginitomaculum sp.]
MSKDKKTKPLSGDTARKIWLAGIGAYGRAFGEAQEQLSKVTKGGGKVFDDLAAKGEMIETMVSDKGKEIAKDAMEKVGSVSGGLDLDDRISKMRSRLKRVDDNVNDGLEDRLDRLEAKMDEVLKLLKPAPKKRTARKPSAKKKPTSKAKK